MRRIGAIIVTLAGLTSLGVGLWILHPAALLAVGGAIVGTVGLLAMDVGE